MSDIKIKLNISKFKNSLVKHLEARMLRVVTELLGYVKTHFGQSNLGGTRPSAPGQPPNIGTGTLRNSIGFSVGIDGTEVVGKYGVIKGPASDYAMALENGYSPHGLAERPFLKPAYFNNRNKIIRILSS